MSAVVEQWFHLSYDYFQNAPGPIKIVCDVTCSIHVCRLAWVLYLGASKAIVCMCTIYWWEDRPSEEAWWDKKKRQECSLQKLCWWPRPFSGRKMEHYPSPESTAVIGMQSTLLALLPHRSYFSFLRHFHDPPPHWPWAHMAAKISDMPHQNRCKICGDGLRMSWWLSQVLELSHIGKHSVMKNRNK